jgi:hypothetical protein
MGDAGRMTLTCSSCGRHHPLTDDEVVFFYPRFFCLSCGQKVPFVIDEARLASLRQSNDRDRCLHEKKGPDTQETMRHVRGDAKPQGMDGG